MEYLLLKFVHVLGAVVLFGTGTGIAFFMLMLHCADEPAFIARTARVVVMADAIFTATAAILQPVTGYLLVLATVRSLSEPWILLSLALYLGVGVFWLPVIRLQMKLRDLATLAAENGTALPKTYHRCLRLWFAFGIPGFGFTLAILWLMIARPTSVAGQRDDRGHIAMLTGQETGEIWFAYDGECPICTYAAHALRIRESVGRLHLVDARVDNLKPR